MRSGRAGRGLVGAQLREDLPGHVLGGDSAFAEGDEDLGHLLVPEREHQRVAGALVLARRDDAQLLRVPAGQASQRFKFALGDAARQRGCERLAEGLQRLAALEQVEGAQATALGRRDHGVDLAAAGGEEAVTAQRQVQPRARAPDQRCEAALQEVEGRRHRVVRAARQVQAARPVGEHQRRQHGLQDQCAAAGGADGEAVVAGMDPAGAELERLRAEFGTDDGGAANLLRRQHAGQVLAHQARLGPLGADAVDAQRRAGAHGQRQRRAQDLPATLAVRAVQFNELVVLVHLVQSPAGCPRRSSLLLADPQPFTHTTCFSVCTTSTRSCWAAMTASMSL